ncbi:hypothetical protein [Methylobacterium sp. NFXW15]|uniref:hypothetical protein n=1 Tax=Methylobacterium sp. NFXW15 TaxID=2819512 RepID=UPI003CF7A939
MNTLGLRSAPKSVTFAIYNTDQRRILNVENLIIPIAFARPDALKFIRVNILDIIREYQVVKAGVRVAESVAQGDHTERTQIEGVIQEAFASSELNSYYIGQVSNISSKVGFDRRLFKSYVDGDECFNGVEGWEEMNKVQREAVLCAIGAENA